MLVICISEVSAGTMLFQDVLGINRLPNYREFTAFLQTMEVYGAGYNDDVDYFRYNKRNNETHTEAMVKQLKRVVECYDLAVKLIERSKVAPTTSIVTSVFKSQFLCLLHFQKALFNKLLVTQQAKHETTENDYHVRPEGHLVLVTCGHRGQPNRAEEKRISRLLRKSGFIPMLEEISQQKHAIEKKFNAMVDQPPLLEESKLSTE